MATTVTYGIVPFPEKRVKPGNRQHATQAHLAGATISVQHKSEARNPKPENTSSRNAFRKFQSLRDNPSPAPP
jgi:hypothetical protein